MASSTQKDSYLSNRRSAHFAHMAAGLDPALVQLAGLIPDFTLRADGTAFMPLHEKHIFRLYKLLPQIEKDPALLQKLFFLDRDVERSSNDVVFDLENPAQALSFARRSFRSAHGEKFIVQTPPLRGTMVGDPLTIFCGTQYGQASENRTVAIHVRLKLEADFWLSEEKRCGQSRWIQTDQVSIIRNDSNWNEMTLTIGVRAAMSTSPKFGQKIHAPAA